MDPPAQKLPSVYNKQKVYVNCNISNSIKTPVLLYVHYLLTCGGIDVMIKHLHSYSYKPVTRPVYRPWPVGRLPKNSIMHVLVSFFITCMHMAAAA